MVLIAVVCATFWQAPSDSSDQQPFRQVITAEMIRDAGVVRPGDLIRLMDGWVFEVVDGFHTQATGGWLSPQPDTWSLWIDGQRLPGSLLGVPDLNLLPVSVHDIACVKVISTPTVVRGEYAGDGVVHVYTKRAADGIGARAGYWEGNEVGDPGPLRYTGKVSNVDKLGPDLSAGISWGNRTVSARLSAVSRDHHPTDAAILPRVQAFANEYPNIVMRGYSGRAEVAGRWGRQVASILYSDTEDYVWLQPAGREVPARHGFLAGSLHGEWRVASRVRIDHSFEYVTSRIEERPNPIEFDPDWQRHVMAGRIEVARIGRRIMGAVGARVQRERATSARLPVAVSHTRPSVYARLGSAGAGPLKYSVTARTTLDDEVPTAAIVTSGTWDLGQRHVLGAVIAYGRRSEAEDSPLRYWIGQGYTFPDTLGIAYVNHAAGGQPVQATADVEWGYRFDQEAEVKVDLMVRHVREQNFDQQAWADSPEGPVFEGPVTVVSGVEGSVVGARMGLRARVRPMVRQHSHVTVRLLTAGASAYEDAWERWPAVQAQTSWTYTPAPSFSLNARFLYRAGASWTAGVVSTDLHRNLSVPAAGVLDFSAQKWFWNRRIRSNLIIRNATNQRYRLHPRGETYDLSLILHLSVWFND